MFKSLETYMTEQELLRHFQTVASPQVYFEAIVNAHGAQALDDTDTESYCDCGEECQTDDEWEHEC
jgi:hypothetical protein